jgi:hypothetical protein
MTKHEGILGLTFEHDLDDCPLAGFELHIHAFAAWNRRAASPVSTLFDAIKHGDAGHRQWLKDAIDAHFAGLPIPPYVASAAASPVEPVAPLRMLTEDEYQALVESEENDFLSIGYVALEKVIQRKFCEVNGLTIGQPVAPAVQEPTSLDEAISSIRYTTELMPGKVPPAPSAAPAGSHWQHRRPGEQWQDGLPSVQVQHDFEFRQVSLPAAPGAASPDKGMKS